MSCPHLREEDVSHLGRLGPAMCCGTTRGSLDLHLLFSGTRAIWDLDNSSSFSTFKMPWYAWITPDLAHRYVALAVFLGTVESSHVNHDCWYRFTMVWPFPVMFCILSSKARSEPRSPSGVNANKMTHWQDLDSSIGICDIRVDPAYRPLHISLRTCRDRDKFMTHVLHADGVSLTPYTTF